MSFVNQWAKSGANQLKLNQYFAKNYDCLKVHRPRCSELFNVLAGGHTSILKSMIIHTSSKWIAFVISTKFTWFVSRELIKARAELSWSFSNIFCSTFVIPLKVDRKENRNKFNKRDFFCTKTNELPIYKTNFFAKSLCSIKSSFYSGLITKKGVGRSSTLFWFWKCVNKKRENKFFLQTGLRCLFC